MRGILFGNTLMLLGIAILNLVGLDLLYAGMIWVSYFLIGGGFFMSGISALVGWILKNQ